MQENYIFYNRECISKNGTDISEDFGIPDYITDIKKIIHCNYILKEHNSYDKGDDIVYEGEVIYELLLLCDDASVKSIVFSSDYSLKIPSAQTDGEIEYEINIENENSRLLSARKVSLRCRVCISVYSKNSVDLMPVPNTPTSDEELVNIERKINEINNSTTVFLNEKSLISSFEIELPSQIPEIESVLYTSITPKINDIKIQENKCIVRGDCYLHILFSGSDGEYTAITRILDFSDFVNTDIQNIKSVIGEVAVKDIKISTDSNSFGENRNINIDYTYDILLTATVENKINYVVDMYSTQSNTQLEYKELEYQNQIDSFITSFSFDYSEQFSDAIDDIIDGYSDIDGVEIRFDGNRSKIIVSGTVYTDIITKSEKENLLLDVYHLKIPFNYEREIASINGELSTDLKIKTLQTDVDISDNRFDLNIEFAIMGIIYDKQTENTVNAYTLQENDKTELSPLVIYYPQDGDDLWTVAKKYKCTSDDIIAVNSLENDSIGNSKVLLIPKSAKRKIFDKVI